MLSSNAGAGDRGGDDSGDEDRHMDRWGNGEMLISEPNRSRRTAGECIDGDGDLAFLTGELLRTHPADLKISDVRSD